MNYKKNKVIYISLLSLSLIFALLSLIKRDVSYINYNLFLLIAIFLMIPGFIFKLLHEQNYPPSKKQKFIGWVLAIFLSILAFFSDKLIYMLSF